MQAIWRGVVVATSDDTVVVERNHYFPRDTVADAHLQPSDHTSVCPWKGTASYFHVVVNGELNRDAAWTYLQPKPAAAEIQGRVAFWRGVQVR